MKMLIFGFKEEKALLLLLKQSLPLLLPSFIGLLFLFKWLRQTSPTLKNLPPSPPKLPIIGNLHQLGSLPQRSLRSLAQKYGPVMLLHLGSKPVLVISSPEAAEQVLKIHDKDFATRPQINFAARLFYNRKDMTFAPYGEHWRQVRSICVVHLLSTRRLQSFKSVREEEIELMLKNIEESRLSNSVISIANVAASLALSIISRVAMGRRYSGEKGGNNFKKMLEEFAMLLGVFNVGDYIPWLAWINHLNGLNAKLKRVAEEFNDSLETIVQEGTQRLEKRVSGHRGGEEEKEQKNFVDILLEVQKTMAAGFPIDHDTIKAVIADMFAAGTDTSSTVLEWTVSELVKNPKVMDKLQDEVRHFAINKSDNITEDDLEKLPYLKAVVKESLRLHPPVPLLVPREARKDVKMMGYDIAAGTQALINAWAIGRDPSLWEEADEFQPERFLNSSVDLKGQHFQLLPFGSGRRSCPGIGLALVITEVALANLIRKFNFALAGGVRPEELDMSEAHSLVTPRKIPLLVVASLPH